MPMTYIDFGNLQWGGGEHGDGLETAENVVPAYGLKRPIEAGVLAGSATETAFNSFYAHVWPVNPGAASYAGDKVTEFWGSKTRLWTYTGGAFSNISLGGGAPYAAAGEPPAWRFASYGNDVWATNRIDQIQVRADNTGNFADGTPASVFKPHPRFLCIVKSYMLGFDLNDAGHFSDSYAWSVPGNPAVWDAAASGGGGTGRITSRPGQIMGAVGGEFARVFKRSSMHALVFTGDVTNPWREDVISPTVGTPYPSSIILGEQGAVYFLGQDHYFYRQVGLSEPERVSTFEISAYLSDADFSPRAILQTAPATMRDEDLRVMGCLNPKTGVAFWVYVDLTSGSTNQKFAGLFYSTITGEWTTWLTASDNGPLGDPLHITVLGGKPHPDGEAGTLAGVVMVQNFDASTSRRWTFAHATKIYRLRLRTRRQALALSQQEEPGLNQVLIQGALPVCSTKSAGAAPVDDAAVFEDLPDLASFAVTVSNDPNFKLVLDGATQVNPRREVIFKTDADTDTGEFPYTLQGTWQVFDFRVDSDLTNGPALRAIPGFWLRWEVPA